MKMTFKPKSLKVHVPGHGVIDREYFNGSHMKACLKQIERSGLDKHEYLKKRFDVVSYGDLPLFDESEDFKNADAEAMKAVEEQARIEAEESAKLEEELKLRAEQEEAEKAAIAKAEEAELLRLLAEEEAQKNTGNETEVK